MKRILIAAALALLAPAVAFAHETQHFRIGDKTYSLVVGSVNEPLVVDDKSGVELTVSEVARVEEGAKKAEIDETKQHEHDTPLPVTGLENTLKVEIAAGNASKTLDLATQNGQLGSYKAVFFPTVQTTLSYRFFGTINDVPVDLTFSCNPAGHPASPEDETEVVLSEHVTRVLKKGAFGCPIAKADLGFPEPAPTLTTLLPADAMKQTEMIAIAGLVVAALALLIGFWAWIRTR